ncbi:MAG: hypothetical protein KBF78_02505 [Fuscovulum sp.]|nr:hypothetical protein [Fuscovulum sp.]
MKLRAIALVALTALAPMGALAQERLNEEQLIALLNERKACGEDRTVVAARYVNETDNKVEVQCEDAEGFVPLAAGLGGLGGVGAAAAGLALVAGAGGGGGGTPSTSGTGN